ncbi:MAG: hypothetical protein V1712_03580 [Patescibacteria group bacterium]
MKINLLIKKIKIPHGAALKFLPMLTIILIVAALILMVNFLYIYFYNTLAQAEEIYIYRSQISLKTIDIDLYNNVFSAIKSKKEFDQKVLTSLSNPFATIEKPILKSEILPDENTAENSKITPVQ